MEHKNAKVREVVRRLEAIQQEVDQLLGQLRTIEGDLHEGEDHMMQTVFGDQSGQSNVAGPSDQKILPKA
jgi:hypothetical protein